VVRRGIGPLLLVLVGWGLLWVPPLLEGRFLPARDLTATHLPWRTVWAAQLRAHALPLWNPASNQGRPLLANPNAMAAYPGTLLFLVAPAETAEVLHLALHHLLLLGGLAVLARRSGASRGAAAVAAATVGTSGVVWSATTFLNVLASLAWATWAVALVAGSPPSTSAARRWAVAAGAMLGVAFLAGEPVIAAVAAAVCTAAALLGWPRRLLLAWTLAPLAALAVAAPVLVPLLAMYPETVRGALGTPPGSLGADALAPRRYLELVLPNLLGGPLADAQSGFWAQPSFPWQRYYPTIFPGPAAIFLVPWSWAQRRRLRVWWVLFAAALFTAAALGVAPVTAFAQHLPLLGHTRFAIKLLVAVTLALAPLVAGGWEEASARPRRHLRRTAALFLLAVLPLLLAAGPLQAPWRAVLAALYPASSPQLAAVPAAQHAAALLGDSAALALPAAALLVAGPQATVGTAAAFAAGWLAGRGVLLFEDAAAWATPPTTLPSGGVPPTVACLARSAAPAEGPRHPELRRFWAARSCLTPDYATRWGARYLLARGPDGLEPLRQELLAAHAATLPLHERARLACALGATVVLADTPVAGMSGRTIQGVWAGECPAPAPEAYLARRVLPVEGAVAAVQTLAAAGFRPGEDAVVEGRGGAEPLAGGTILATWGPPHHRRYRLSLTGPGLFVLQQSYLSAWRARLDGAPATVEVANAAGIGVRVPAGEHTVELYLAPAPYWLGLLGPFLLLATIMVRWAAPRRQARRSASGGPVHSSPATPPAP
jgi:hypothetical protein